MVFDQMYDRITSEITSKMEAPLTPGSVTNINSPRNNTQNGFQGHANNPGAQGIPSNFLVNNPHFQKIASLVDSHAKIINDTTRRVHGLQQTVNLAQQSITHLPQQIQMYGEDVNRRLADFQSKHQQLHADFTQVIPRITHLEGTLAQILQASDRRFTDVAVHMDTVKQRFAEHRKQLENLIRAWKETVSTMGELRGTNESFEVFLQKEILPILGVVRKKYPELVKDATERLASSLAV
jgi:ABC-type transporter Mla subunit MlaD